MRVFSIISARAPKLVEKVFGSAVAASMRSEIQFTSLNPLAPSKSAAVAPSLGRSATPRKPYA